MGIPSIGPGRTDLPPRWAILERDLLARSQEAAREFVRTYTLPDGSLRWRTEWPGIDGSDDAYEPFWTHPLLYLLGGDEDLLRTAARQWEAVTWQWTEYGQIHREFDASYDWMHHGESSTLFYLLGQSDPSAVRFRQRAVRFADFYTGGDPQAPNYDRRLRLIRSPLSGSRGPRFVTTAEDWSTHREVLDGYPPPFEDVPANPDGTCTWTDDTVFAAILERMNRRMTRGDVPLNLTATSLGAHAWLMTGQDRFRDWVRDYLAAWVERTRRNGGIVPDNVGLDDEIGQNLGGRWYGGYYGWRWPHGAGHILEALGIAGVAGTVAGGDSSALDLVRSQLDALWDLGRGTGAARCIPYKHGENGWHDFRTPDPAVPVYAWYLSQDPADLERVHRLMPEGGWTSVSDRIAKGSGAANSAAWFSYLQGRNPDYAEQILRTNHRQLLTRLEAIRGDDLSRAAEWDVHHWQDRNPVMAEGLVQLMLGAPLQLYHGGLLTSTVRYLDPERTRPGLPPDVAALVERIDASSVTLHLVNCSSRHPRSVIVQAGGYGEHTFGEVTPDSGPALQVDGPHLQVDLGASCRIRLTARLHRFSRTASYRTPFCDPADAPGLLVGRPPRAADNAEGG